MAAWDTHPVASASGPGWESLFWMLFERSANPIGLLDEQRRFVDLNAPALRMLGRTRGDVVGRPVTDFIKADELRAADVDWRTFLRAGEFAGSRTFVRLDGTEVVAELAARRATVNGRRLALYVTLTTEEPMPDLAGGRPDTTALTNREREVVTLIALGEDTAGIAQTLQISPETVRTHVRNAMHKLGAHTRAQLVAACLVSDAAVALPHLP